MTKAVKHGANRQLLQNLGIRPVVSRRKVDLKCNSKVNGWNYFVRHGQVFPGKVDIYLNDELVASDVENQPYLIPNLAAGDYRVNVKDVNWPDELFSQNAMQNLNSQTK
jgi:hypothetical protein